MRDISVKRESYRGIALVPLCTELLSKRVIYMEGKINSELATEIVREIFLMNLESNDPIRIFITSEGGEITAGLAIYDAIQTSKAPVETIVVGFAYSMGAVLACSGKKRSILENSKMMLHQPLISEFGGNASEITKLSESLNKTKEKMNKIVAKHTQKSLKEVSRVTSMDTYFTSEEAIKFGLIDEIVGIDDLVGKRKEVEYVR